MTSLELPEPLYHNPTEDEPRIILDPERNHFEFSGKSLPEDPGSLFLPVIKWAEEYARAPNEETVINFKMEYFNSSTARFFVEILEIFEEMKQSGHNVRVCWWHEEEDEIMQERGEEIESILDLEFDYMIMRR